jgi:RibD C-terminal domain/YCII-related domain
MALKIEIRELFAPTFATKMLNLKQERGKNILVGGVDSPSQLMQLGLIDEYRFVVGPTLAGAGRRLLEGVSLPEKLQLKLVESKFFKSGCVALHYSKQCQKNLRHLCCWPPSRGRRSMKYICLGYCDRSKHEAITEAEKQAMFDTCFIYDDHLRANGHWVGGEPIQPAETALTLYWKNGKVATTDGPYAETKEQLGAILFLEA